MHIDEYHVLSPATLKTLLIRLKGNKVESIWKFRYIHEQEHILLFHCCVCVNFKKRDLLLFSSNEDCKVDKLNNLTIFRQICGRVEFPEEYHHVLENRYVCLKRLS